jgi:uncharacterized protein (UPF0332 family)
MTLQRLLAEGRLRRQAAARDEIVGLLRVAARDLADARATVISDDRRFATAYNAALQLATIVLRAEGYRTAGAGHHRTTIAALPQVLGPVLSSTADYLDACRSKRNTVDYDGIGVATEADVIELIDEATRLQGTIESWLRENHPDLA